MQWSGDLTFNPFAPNRFLDARPPASGAFFQPFLPEHKMVRFPLMFIKIKIHERAAIHEGKDRIEFDMTIDHWQNFFERSLD